ncbi:MAG: hypothetical protein LBE09_09460 [Christensenellaceae bacterium]|jgi:hypothetical protein|nr:hypothetical protein [Christensenellaceae bacterium]
MHTKKTRNRILVLLAGMFLLVLTFAVVFIDLVDNAEVQSLQILETSDSALVANISSEQISLPRDNWEEAVIFDELTLTNRDSAVEVLSSLDLLELASLKLDGSALCADPCVDFDCVSAHKLELCDSNFCQSNQIYLARSVLSNRFAIYKTHQSVEIQSIPIGSDSFQYDDEDRLVDIVLLSPYGNLLNEPFAAIPEETPPVILLDSINHSFVMILDTTVSSIIFLVYLFSTVSLIDGYHNKFERAKIAGIVDRSRPTKFAVPSFALKIITLILAYFVMLWTWLVLLLYGLDVGFPAVFIDPTPRDYIVVPVIVVILYSLILIIPSRHIRRKWKELEIPKAKKQLKKPNALINNTQGARDNLTDTQTRSQGYLSTPPISPNLSSIPAQNAFDMVYNPKSYTQNATQKENPLFNSISLSSLIAINTQMDASKQVINKGQLTNYSIKSTKSINDARNYSANLSNNPKVSSTLANNYTVGYFDDRASNTKSGSDNSLNKGVLNSISENSSNTSNLGTSRENWASYIDNYNKSKHNSPNEINKGNTTSDTSNKNPASPVNSNDSKSKN